MEKINYSKKLKNKDLSGFSDSDINDIINFLNFCFNERNNFFITNFNQKNLKLVYNFYGKIKSNIFSKDINNIFDDISLEMIKLIKFILLNLTKYDVNIQKNHFTNLQKCLDCLKTLQEIKQIP